MGNGLFIQISDHDAYQLTPLHLDQFLDVPKVPVIRVYGALRVPGSIRDEAYNTVVHVHNFYPYLYVDCLVTDESKLTDEYLGRVTDLIEAALAESFKRGPIASDSEEDSEEENDAQNNGQEKSHSRRFVAAVKLCRGCAMYGYHLGYSLVLKISLLLPLYKTRLTRLISENKVDFASVSGRKKYAAPHVYEAHITYLSQFFADFNLYGCSWLEVEECKFRTPLVVPNGQRTGNLKAFLLLHINASNVLLPARYPRLGRSILEIDISVGDIINRRRLRERRQHENFAEFSGNVSNQIYLTSLQHTLNDLKYQCELRGDASTSQLLHESYSQVFSKIGERGYESWETTDHMKSLMPYVMKLNQATGITDPNEYYSRIVEPINLGILLPTAFEMVDLYLPLTAYADVPLLNFRDDLVRWKSLDELFRIEDEFVTQIQFESNNSLSGNQTLDPSASLKKDQNLRPEQSDAGTDRKEVPEPFEILQVDEIPSSANDVIPLLLPPSDTETPVVHVPQSFDTHLFAMTQKYRQLPSESFAESSSLSATSHQLLKNPMYIWEWRIPVVLTKARFKETMARKGHLEHDYHDPAYFRQEDMHKQPLVFANRKILVPYRGPKIQQPALSGVFTSMQHQEVLEKSGPYVGRPQLWQYHQPAPSRKEVTDWLLTSHSKMTYKRAKFRSQIEPDVTRTFDYKYSLRSGRVERNPSGFLNLSYMHMEIHANTLGDLLPDPSVNSIAAICYHFDDANNMFGDGRRKTVLLINQEVIEQEFLEKQLRNIAALSETDIRCFESEKAMVADLVSAVDTFDPDILGGYEINSSSWGYLVERFRVAYDMNLLPRLSRSLYKSNGKFGDRWGYTHTSVIKINGRHLLNVWRLLRSELSLTSYSLENVCFHLLHRPLPRFSNLVLSNWCQSGEIGPLLMFCQYFVHRIELVLQIMDMQEFIIRNIEQLRLIGVDFYSNFYRGSQFKVESILLRIAKEENMLLESPSKLQVHNMRALEVIPLILEPDSNFYKSPLVVLDFQSLYPSIMIAYNYCYSTLVGKIEGFEQNKNPIGTMTHLKLPRGIIELLWKNNGLHISPNGYMFVSARFRKSVLSRMLSEILNMRINVRAIAGAFKNDHQLASLYHSKQLALKLIANVTYGYTSASFSGRMPNTDIADAIVATGREIMTKSIEMIESSEYGAKVVYGDTDSLFVYFPGRSKEDAFKFGKVLAEEVSQFMPDPVKLKFEKVYHPCVLLAKKRYAGNCFEYELQVKGKFEAKGIETVRRDGIPAQLKMVGKCLRILFETKNLSMIKEYVVKQFYKILFNKVNVKDFCFAKEVRYGSYKNEIYLPPGAVLAKKKLQKDPRSEPQYRERIPYLVTRDVTNQRIRDRSVSPEDFIASFSSPNPMELDFEYYITRVLIPPLERVLNLIGVKVREWYALMPKTTKHASLAQTDILKISEFVSSKHCLRCAKQLEEERYVCQECLEEPVELVNDLTYTVKERETIAKNYYDLCVECNIRSFGYFARKDLADQCSNGDCQVFYAKIKARRELQHLYEERAKACSEL